MAEKEKDKEKDKEKTAIVLLVDGSEEMEAVTIVDILRRAGVLVTIAGVWDGTCVRCSRNVKICTDAVFTDATQDRNYDIVILPGGINGSKAFTSSVEVGKLLQKQHEKEKFIAAICAAPTALKTHNIGKGKRITCYPSMKEELSGDYVYCEDKVVIDGNLITSRGPATAIDFSLSIVKRLLSEEKARSVANGLLYDATNEIL